MAEITCSRCGNKYDAQVYQSINVGKNPELKEKVISGELFMSSCPQCGTTNLIRSTMLYHDPEQKLIICLADHDIKLSSEGLEGYTCRLVTSVGELIEKIKIHDAGLDDITMELCKFVTCSEMQKDVQLKFLKVDGADGEITLTYPEKGQMEMLVIGYNVYEDCQGIINRNPVLKEKATGLIRIDGQWLSQFLR